MMRRGLRFGIGLLLRRERCAATPLDRKFGALSIFLGRSIYSTSGDGSVRCCAQWQRGFCGYAVEQFSHECEFENQKVVIPRSLQRRVEGLRQEHLDRMLLTSNKVSDELEESSSSKDVEDVEPDESQDSMVDSSVMENILQRKSTRIRNLQRTWQDDDGSHQDDDGNSPLDLTDNMLKLLIRSRRKSRHCSG